MNEVWIAVIVVAVAIGIGMIVKVRLSRKLRNIDGLNGAMTVDKTKEETIIGKFGDEK